MAESKPELDMTRVDGNIFNIVSVAGRTMRKAGISQDTVNLMKDRVMKSSTYDKALNIVQEYVEFT